MMGIKNYICYNLIKLIFLIINIRNINSIFSFENESLVMPFKELYSDSNIFSINNVDEYNITRFLYENLYNNLYSIIEVGKPIQKLIAVYNFNNDKFLLKQTSEITQLKNYINNIKESYYLSKSTTITNTSSQLDSINSDRYFNFNETFYFYIDKQQKNLVEVSNFVFCIPKTNNPNLSNISLYAELGFPINDRVFEENIFSFLEQLKANINIHKYLTTIEYISDDEGYFYIGKYNEENENIQAYSTYSIPQVVSFFSILVDNIFISNNKDNDFKVKTIIFSVKYGVIIGTEEYFKKIKYLFFNEYINKKICEVETIYLQEELKNYGVISCDSNDLDIKKFPSINFYNKYMDITFELTYENLFLLKEKKYYFLIVKKDNIRDNYEDDEECWIFGKPFFKKYKTSFNLDAKIISFYGKKNVVEKNEKEFNFKKVAYILAFILSIFVIVCLIMIIKQLKEDRKTRTNELDDDYDYTTSIPTNIN